jgi:hypothetical protein
MPLDKCMQSLVSNVEQARAVKLSKICHEKLRGIHGRFDGFLEKKKTINHDA